MTVRSYLFVPGDSPKKLDKIATSGADAVIICLEDAVAEVNKQKGRMITADFLQAANRPNTRLWVRVNPISSDHLLNDLVAVMSGKPYGIFLPKPSSGDDLKRLDHYISVLEVQHGIEPASTRIMTVAESALGTIYQAEFSRATPRLTAMTWGAEDLSAEIGATTNVDENGAYFLVHQINRANCLVVCAAGDMQPVDGICVDFGDEQGLRQQCLRARKEGFTGKIAIHPAQVAIINECFTPSASEIDYARRVVAAFDAAPDAGTLGFEGRMLDLPHLTQAQQILARFDKA